MLKRSIMLVSMLIGVFRWTYAEDLEKGLCFYLPFDGNLDAKVSEGIESPQRSVESRYEKGIKGKGLIINGMDKLSYNAKRGYFSFEKGTISLWIKPNYDDVAFREKVDKDIKTQEWYFAQQFFGVGNWGEVKSSLALSQNVDGFHSTLYTHPNIQHYKTAKLSLEKDKWINIIYTWDISDKDLELYVNGSKVKTKISQLADDWNVPEETDYAKCTIDIGGGYMVDKREKKRTADEKNAIWKTILPENFTFTIDEARIYDRVLEENEIKLLYVTLCPF